MLLSITIVGGANEMVEKIRKDVRDLNLEKNIHLFGFLHSHDEVFGALKKVFRL
jgi:ribosomal protein L30/L7E